MGTCCAGGSSPARRRLKRGEDTFGNVLHTFSAGGSVEALTIRVTGEVETNETHGVVRGAVERLPDIFYLRESSLAHADEIRAFTRDAMGDVGADRLAGLHRLVAALHREVIFDTEPTHAATTAAEAFALRRGVCQDLSHIFIAAARSMGIPARYVSGYFHRIDGVTDQEAGHAWAEAKVPDLGWVGFDPANGISAGDAHVRVAVGLDYLGAAPIRGSRCGGGSETRREAHRGERPGPDAGLSPSLARGPGNLLPLARLIDLPREHP